MAPRWAPKMYSVTVLLYISSILYRHAFGVKLYFYNLPSIINFVDSFTASSRRYCSFDDYIVHRTSLLSGGCYSSLKGSPVDRYQLLGGNFLRAYILCTLLFSPTYSLRTPVQPSLSLHLHHLVPCSAYFSTLKMEASDFTEIMETI
jgi:hypothetical protein